ncbi:histidine phosphatase family protein [Nocardioides cavernaquae]|uniref:Histidine phosphatase family protein n=1 Tax=Nocardioides cavernaquae TaxID=2321396 RepID=A0A3A5HC72_9ACTN|nr:histidine phosphatase family protein [Nocardioides cavernaquae]RJS45654.1 histidine phosphatase family protein [Nocardioides cavernaquae]
MSVLLLVRHGQASFGKRDYDALSEVGHEQSRVLGRALAARGVVPDVIVRGELRRHRETAEGILEGLGGVGAELPIEVDPGWDEFDFKHVMEVHKPLYRSRTLMLADYVRTPARERRARFQAMFEEATERWTGGVADADYRESFTAFSERVDAAARRSAAHSAGTVLVVSSGGPIGLVASHLLAGDASLWATLNKVAVNTGVTKVVRGRSGLTLSSYNEHTHVEHDRALLTYR